MTKQFFLHASKNLIQYWADLIVCAAWSKIYSVNMFTHASVSLVKLPTEKNWKINNADSWFGRGYCKSDPNPIIAVMLIYLHVALTRVSHLSEPRQLLTLWDIILVYKRMIVSGKITKIPFTICFLSAFTRTTNAFSMLLRFYPNCYSSSFFARN